jgi:hypothetical protein
VVAAGAPAKIPQLWETPQDDGIAYGTRESPKRGEL